MHTVQLQEEDTGSRGHPEREKDFLWLVWEVCHHLSYCFSLIIKLTNTHLLIKHYLVNAGIHAVDDIYQCQ